MTKKKRNNKTDKPDDLESAEIESGNVDQVPAGKEADASDSGEVDAASDNFSMDDLLDDVRKSLIEDEQTQKDSKSGWWNQRSKARSKEQPHDEPDVNTATVPDMPVLDESKTDAYVDQIDELIDMLDVESSPKIEVPAPVVEEPVIPEPAAPQQPEPPVDMDELKKRAFAARDSEPQTDFSEVRSVALGGNDDVFVEVEASSVDVRQDRLKSFENSLRPFRQYIYFIVAFLAFVVVALVSMTMYSVYQRSRPTEVAVTLDPNLPYPTGLVLPGGLSFNLGRGVISEGAWNPRGPEWLQGTEICRWVAIPWSTQLEAVVRTLTRKDTIEIVMNNSDRLTYTVDSIKELTLAEMQALDQNSPCLLLVLSDENAEAWWAVTALP